MVDLKNEILNTSMLVVVTGIYGSGTTELATEISEKLGIRHLSIDKFMLKEYKNGFDNYSEKFKLNDLAIHKFMVECAKHLCSSESIVVDYTFTDDWNEYFEKACLLYGYKLLVVNCNTKEFDDIWKRYVDGAYINDVSAYSSAHDGKNFIIDKRMVEQQYYAIMLSEYQSGKYTSIKGDYVVSDKEIIDILSK